ncbi:MAG: hypothetical protein B7Y25_04925 [Alphaproteobacteria bacterium 16-39-46]|nr:MAG: hypothetical protein B7Y25_04925 [Alphaproteobacteria bacterium 16-39-46]OZA42860.1 MAG: hypothetical protein B7X84_04740 [Alphaproteobacteria bacterium 17-39-52]HQS84247.1 DUF6290 family protein [Alphaproteobacteria bacterium]HQS94101.1 DUF6290 family protein [Alphaproteobacteria bacterium]
MTAAVRLPEELQKRLDNLATKTHRSKSYYLRHALEVFLEEKEDVLIASSRWEEYKKNGEKGISLEEIEKKMGLKSE